MKILIVGGSGFIGTKLSEHFNKKMYGVDILTRNTANKKKDTEFIKFITELEFNKKDYDVIINLAGEPLNSSRWNDEVKNNIYKSRIETTRNIVEYIKNQKKAPTLINASAIGIYGNDEEKIFNEDAIITAQDFTQKLCRDWEKEAEKASLYGARVCLIRLGIVLGENGGALLKMTPAFKLGVGAILGNGKQWMSWVHIDDVINAIDFIIHHNELYGPFNITSPEPCSNKIFSQELALSLNRPCFFKIPGLIVKMIFGEMAEAIVLKGQKVLPTRLLSAGFGFKFLKIKDAFYDIFH